MLSKTMNDRKDEPNGAHKRFIRPRTFFHGTKASLQLGELLNQKESNFEAGRISNYIYFTTTLDAAKWGAELAKGTGQERIYLVEPTGPFENDPNLTDKRFLVIRPVPTVLPLR